MLSRTRSRSIAGTWLALPVLVLAGCGFSDRAGAPPATSAGPSAGAGVTNARPTIAGPQVTTNARDAAAPLLAQLDSPFVLEAA